MALPSVVMGLDPFASGITLAAMWAADISTACTILLGAGTLFSQDIYKRFINPGISGEKFLFVNRVTIFVCGMGTLWLAFNAVGILKTMVAGLSLTTALTVVFLFTIFMLGVRLPQKFCFLHNFGRLDCYCCLAICASFACFTACNLF